ncbi:MAG TPA: cytochrome c [Myxococcota bacterium]|jgi:mono/diheme cytochrome c family protein
MSVVVRALAVALVLASACTPRSQSVRMPTGGLQRMIDQPRASDERETSVFDDGTLERAPPQGTLPFGDPAPRPPLSRALLDDGERQFDRVCATCHGRVGDGDSIVAHHMQFRPPADLHVERLRAQPAQYFFDVATTGFGLMPSCADQLDDRDRWAVAEYVKVLQASRHTPIASLPIDVQRTLTTTRGGLDGADRGPR